MRFACWISKATRADVQARARASACSRSRPPTPIHAHTHARTVMHSPTQTHTRAEITNTAFPRQQWLRKRASVSRYTYIACLDMHLLPNSPKEIKESFCSSVAHGHTVMHSCTL